MDYNQIFEDDENIFQIETDISENEVFSNQYAENEIDTLVLADQFFSVNSNSFSFSPSEITNNFETASTSFQNDDTSSISSQKNETFSTEPQISKYRPLFKSKRKIGVTQPFLIQPLSYTQDNQNFINSSNRLPLSDISSRNDSLPNSSANIGNTSKFFSGDLSNLKSVTAIPEKFRSIFKQFPTFNFLQSKVFDEVFYTDKSIVVSAPTGSGKTVVLELAIVRLLMKYSANLAENNFKIIYMAPIKALCSERYCDWKQKFLRLGLTCAELTGDTEGNEFFILQDAQIILTTPEKWDSLTRNWRKDDCIVQSVKLFFIDEVHLLNDDTRGPTLEAVVSRMKMLHTTIDKQSNNKLRFVATSATIPNADDIAEWLGYEDTPALSFKVSDEMRPVKLKKIVLSYPCPEKWTQFRFDLSLSYKLANVLHTYGEGKPALIFCATRSAVVETAKTLSREMGSQVQIQQKQDMFPMANNIKDAKLRELVFCGIAFHHAGLSWNDRQIVEVLFSNSKLLILVATSTLAMGVNLPAHLVVIKSTFKYVAGSCVEYTESEILQMIGRAGRPQFDISGTAVIMTKTSLKEKYQSLIGGTQMIESHMHKHLTEHLNAEIVLRTITDMGVLLNWIKSTFLYVRVLKNPKLYSIQEGLVKNKTEQKLLDMCVRAVNTLVQHEIVLMNENGFDLSPTSAGRLMARYYLAFETMKLFMKIDSEANINDLVILLSSCKEFSDVSLRTNEKKTLNLLNKNKYKVSIRFPMDGKIKTGKMKVNCLIQAAFGCIPIQEPGLNQEVLRIIRVGRRLSRCLAEFLTASRVDFKTCVNAVLLAKCFRAQLWENSSHVAKQLDKVGTVMANALVNAGLTSFQKIEDTNPREIEMILNRNPPFGNAVLRSIKKLPKFQITLEQSPTYLPNSAEITLKISLMNWENLSGVEKSEKSSDFNCTLFVGDADNKIVFKQRILKVSLMQSGRWMKRINVYRAKSKREIYIRLISDDIVGVDLQTTFTPVYTKGEIKATDEFEFPDDDVTFDEFEAISPTPKSELATCSSKSLRKCNHSCVNKVTCRHNCCKYGVTLKLKKRLPAEESAKQSRINLAGKFQEKAAEFPNIPFATNSTPKISNTKLKLQQIEKSNLKLIDTSSNLNTTLKNKKFLTTPELTCFNSNDSDMTNNFLASTDYHNEWDELDDELFNQEYDRSVKTFNSESIQNEEIIDLTSTLSDDDWSELIHRDDISEENNHDNLAVAEDFQELECSVNRLPKFNLDFDYATMFSVNDSQLEETKDLLKLQMGSRSTPSKITQTTPSRAISGMFVGNEFDNEQAANELMSTCYDLMNVL